MADKEDKKNTDFSFIQEKIKQRPIYQNRMVQKCIWSMVFGTLFGVASLIVWFIAAPRIADQSKGQIQPIEFPEEETEELSPKEEEELAVEEQAESPVYIREKVSMELDDYAKLYQQLMQIGSQAEKSMVDVLAMSVDTDWFDETYTSQSSTAGVIIGDNGLELLILTNYDWIDDRENLQITFFDHTTAGGALKKFDKNTGLAVIGVNLSEISQASMDILQYADLGSSRTLKNGEPVIAVGSPVGTFGSLLFGNLTSTSQMASLYDGNCNVLTTDITGAGGGSGVLVNWDGKIIGLIQEKHEVHSQEGTIQAYGISDLKDVIEHLSNNQDIVYMGILGADVTTPISEAEDIPIGVYVSETVLESPAIEAGIQPGDIITSMSGQPITNLKDMMSILLKCSNEQDIQVVCQRPDKTGYQELDVSVKLKILE